MNKKMTMKNTVEEIKVVLGDVAGTVKKLDKDLFKRFVEANKKLNANERVPKKDLLALVNEAIEVIDKAEKATPKKEASVKPAASKSKKAPAKKAAPAKKEAKKTPAKKSATKETASSKKKAPAKKSPAKKASKKVAKETAPKLDDMFPKTFEDESGVYTRADDIKDLNDLREALENDEDIFTAAYLTPEFLKNFDYGAGQLPKSKVPKKFNRNLDLCAVVFAGENIPNFITVSTYTEVSYWWKGSSLKQTAKGRKATHFMYEVYRYEEQ